MGFQNKVSTFTTGIKDTTALNMSTVAAIGLKFRQEKEQEALVESQLVNLTSTDYLDKQSILAENVLNVAMFEKQLHSKIQKIEQDGREMLFKEVMTEMALGSLLLDEEFIQSNSDVLTEAVHDYIDERGGFKMLESALVNNRTPWLEDLHSLCVETSRTIARRKMKTAKPEDGIEKINFDMDKEEKSDFDYNKDSLSADQIIDLVKSKTMTVIKDEKQRQTKEQEMDEELEAHYAELAANGKDVAKEQASWKQLNGSVVEESSIFNSLFRSSFEELLTDKASPKPTTESMLGGFKLTQREKDIVQQIYAVRVIETGDFVKLRPLLTKLLASTQTRKEVLWMQKDAKNVLKQKSANPAFEKQFKDHQKWIEGTFLSLIEKRLTAITKVGTDKKLKESAAYIGTFILAENVSAMMSSIINEEEEDQFQDGEYNENATEDDIKTSEDVKLTLEDEISEHIANDDDINMDLALAEALTKYTIMECFHTTKLETFTTRELQVMSQELLS